LPPQAESKIGSKEPENRQNPELHKRSNIRRCELSARKIYIGN
jgi:hypothetical protein